MCCVLMSQLRSSWFVLSTPQACEKTKKAALQSALENTRMYVPAVPSEASYLVLDDLRSMPTTRLLTQHPRLALSSFRSNLLCLSLSFLPTLPCVTFAWVKNPFDRMILHPLS